MAYEPNSVRHYHSFILPLYSAVFGMMRRLTLAHWLLRIVPRRLYHPVIDAVVVSNLLLAVVAATCGSVDQCYLHILAFYGAYRLFELLVLYPNYLFFDEFRAIAAGGGGLGQPPLDYRRIVIHTMHNYTEIVFWFAALFRILHTYFVVNANTLGSGASLSQPAIAIYYSVTTITTLGYGDISPSGSIGAMISVAETGIGVFLVLMVLARWLGLMPSVKRKDSIM